MISTACIASGVGMDLHGGKPLVLFVVCILDSGSPVSWINTGRPEQRLSKRFIVQDHLPISTIVTFDTE